MMNNLLLYMSLIFILGGYINIIYLYYKNKSTNYTKISSDLARELDNNETIVILDKNIHSSYYDTKRKVIKLTNNMYNSRSYFSIAYIYILNNIYKNSNKVIETFPKTRVISYIPLIILLINIFVYDGISANTMIIINIISIIYIYILFNIINNINLVNIDTKINNIINSIIKTYTIFFIGILFLTLRLIVIML